MFYLYVVFHSPIGAQGAFYKGANHVINKVEQNRFTSGIANKITMATGNLIQPSQIVIVDWKDLPESVVKERWPEDFPEADEDDENRET